MTFLCSQFSNLGRACLIPHGICWDGKPEMTYSLTCMVRESGASTSTCLVWAFSQMVLGSWTLHVMTDSGGANSRSCWAALSFMPGTSPVPAQQILLAKNKSQASPYSGRGDCTRCGHWQDGVLGPPRNTTYEPYILLKGKMVTFLLRLFFYYLILLASYFYNAMM